MATVFELIEGTNGLLPYINSIHADDFNHLQVRPYGFQAPGLLDPSAFASGYQLRGMRGINKDPEGKPSTLPLLLGKIIPIPTPIATSNRDSFELGHRISATIIDWCNCEAEGLVQWTGVDFERTREQSRDVASVRQNAWYWILRWQIELVGHFDFP